ncbi:hypothetical protein Droror1_Dr00027215 [Drosera rotundifolia]
MSHKQLNPPKRRDQERYEQLKRRCMQKTRYLDPPTLTTFGLKDDTDALLTIGKKKEDQVLSIHFRLGDISYEKSMAWVNHVYNFRARGPHLEPPEFTRAVGSFWLDLNNLKPVEFRTAKVSAVQYPMLWYVHRNFPHIVFCRNATVFHAARIYGTISLGGLLTPIALKLIPDTAPLSSCLSLGHRLILLPNCCQPRTPSYHQRRLSTRAQHPPATIIYAQPPPSSTPSHAQPPLSFCSLPQPATTCVAAWGVG